MRLNSINNQTIALAGIAQVCSLVRELATTGHADEQAMQTSITSVLKIDADSVIDVYGGRLMGLALGLDDLQQQLTAQSTHVEHIRYAASLLFLERNLAKRPDMQRSINIGIQKAQAQAEHFGVLHENVVTGLADVYLSTISTLEPRIMIHGDQAFLSNQQVVNKIRALLLAGIRSAWLWRQCGGTRWKFFFYRNKLLRSCLALLSLARSERSFEQP